MFETKIIKRNGHIIEFIPIVQKCTYHYEENNKKCPNCNNIMKYIDGYHMIITKINGQKIGFTVDNIK